MHQLHALLGRVDLANGVKHVTIDRYNFIIFDQLSSNLVHFLRIAQKTLVKSDGMKN